MPISVVNARENNLRGVSLELPTGALIVFTGVSGSGKSSLAFDTLHAEGRRRLVDALASSHRALLNAGRRPEVDAISGLPPTLAVAQRGGAAAGKRTTIGTLTDVTPLLRILFARCGVQHCPTCDRVVTPRPPEAIVAAITALPEGKRLTLLAPRVRGEAGSHRSLFKGMQEGGFVRVRVDGAISRLEDLAPLDARVAHDIDVVVDRIRTGPGKEGRLAESVRLALKAGDGRVIADVDGEEQFFSEKAWCGHCQVSWPAISERLLSFSRPGGACEGCKGLGSVTVQEAGEERVAVCEVCEGRRLSSVGAAIRLNDESLPALSARPLDAVPARLAALEASGAPGLASVGPVLEELRHRLGVLEDVGLGYLSLDRTGPTLSGGELQRVRLAGCAGSRLSGVLYVLDEPTAGLHPDDTERLIVLMTRLRDAGGTVLVVEHDPAVINAADHCVDFGPGAGPEGGELIFEGTPQALREADTATGRWLSGREAPPPRPGRKPRRHLTLRGATGHNLAGVDARFALRAFTAVTGVSGAGKSSLVFDTLRRALAAQLGQSGPAPLPFEALEGAEDVLRLVAVDDAPVGRSPRSMPATALQIWDPLRRLFAATKASRIRGFAASHFSLAHRGGRCEACKGQGAVEVDLGFLAGVYVPCDHCQGRRFAPDTLAVRYRDLDLSQVLELTVREARERFAGHPSLDGPLSAADAVGLGYLPLGRGAQTLSGGEARRIKLARELGRGGQKAGTIVLLDEPGTGLHPKDVAGVTEVLHRMVDTGSTIIAVAHDPMVVAAADRELALGPGAGPEGGRIVYQGAPR